MSAKRTIGAVVFDGFELLDLFGPLEMFGMYRDAFDIRVIGTGRGDAVCSAASHQGPRVEIDAAIGEVGVGADPAPEMMLVPGGQGTRALVSDEMFLSEIKRLSERAELVTSVCTGSALLARAGVLDGRAATTNKRAFDWVTEQAPNVDWRRQARWVEDGPVWTSSGVSAGIDMSLAIIARLLGDQAARNAAAWAEYTAHWDAADDPFAIEQGAPGRRDGDDR